MMKKVKRLILGALIISLSFSEVKSQTYFKVDITSGNLWTGFAGVGASLLINKSCEGFLIDNYITINQFPYSEVNNNNRHISANSAVNFEDSHGKFPEILNGLGTGIKLGYQKEYNNFFNHWILYGSLHLTYNYFKLEMNENNSLLEKYGNSIIRISPGIGGQVQLGNLDGDVSVKLDVNVRYDFPVLYKGEFGENAKCLKSGFSPRISLFVVGPWIFKKRLGANLGVFYEFMTYKWFKPSEYFNEPFMKGNTYGINFTLFPW